MSKMTKGFKPLFRLMLTRPKKAGALMIDLGVPSQALWMALTLISVSVSLLASGLLHMVPLPDVEMGLLVRNSLPYTSPLLFALANWGNAALSVFIFLWIGRIFGGTGQIHDILSVIVLLQGTAVIVLTGLVAVGFILPLISSILMLGVAFWAIWAMICLMDVAHGFQNIGKAIGTFFVAAIGVPMGLSLFTGAIAALTAGVN